MAEICLSCYNKEHKAQLTERDVVLSEDYCDVCNRQKPCISRIKQKGVLSFLRRLFGR